MSEVNKNLSHAEAIKALCDCAATVTVLSYQEAIEGYFSLRGLPIPAHPLPEQPQEGEDKLPCDIKLPPATLIRAGCSFETLRVALSNPDRPKHFPETAAERQARAVMMPQSGSVTAPSGGQSYGMLSGCMDFTEPSPPSPQPDMGSGEAVALSDILTKHDRTARYQHLGEGNRHYTCDAVEVLITDIKATLSPPASQSVEKMREALEAACNLKWCKEDRLDQAIKLLREALSALPHKEEAADDMGGHEVFGVYAAPPAQDQTKGVEA